MNELWWIQLYINPNRDTSVELDIFAKMDWVAKCSWDLGHAGPGRSKKSGWKVSRIGNPQSVSVGKHVVWDAFHFWIHLLHDWIDFTQHKPYQLQLTGVSFSNSVKQQQMQIHWAIQTSIVSHSMPDFFELHLFRFHVSVAVQVFLETFPWHPRDQWTMHGSWCVP